MARKKAKHTIDKKMIIEAFADMAKSKNIDRDLLQGVLEETLSMIVRKKYGMESNFDIIVNMQQGDIEIYMMRDIVEEVEDPELQISVEQANLHAQEGEEYEVGEEFIEEITLDNLADNFGRRLIALASQNLNQKIRDIEKDQIYNDYVNKVGDIIIGEIYQVRRNDILVLHDKVEVRLPREEQIHGETYRYKKNQTIKAVVKEVRRSSQGGHPDIIISRASKEYLSRLFEVEIPEIYDGIIQIKAIEREAGERSKVAVMSFDDRVDPVGACVGMKGIRIHSIVRELNNENIDLVEWSEDDAEFIKRALSPAKIKEVQIDKETRSANVVVPDDQVSFAIGKSGQNVRLASKLTGYNLTLIKEGGEDIDLDEFKVEFGDDLYDELVSMRIETAREFLETAPEELLEIEGMSKQLLLELRSIILIEFDERESQAMKDRIMNAEIGYIDSAESVATTDNKEEVASEVPTVKPEAKEEVFEEVAVVTEVKVEEEVSDEAKVETEEKEDESTEQ